MKSLAELFKNVPDVKFFGPDPHSCRPHSLVSDSRRVIPDALFFAMDGLRSRGSNYAPDAVLRGAVAVVSRERLNLPADVAQAVVPNVAQAAALVAREFYAPAVPDDNASAHRPFPLVGVTGTNGKTSVTSLIRFLMMRQTDAPWGLIGTVRYELGRRSIPSYRTTPEALDLAGFFAEMRTANCAGAVMEVSSHAISQNRVYALPFSVVAFTNLTQDHMDYHGTMENYFAVKSRLFDGSQGSFPSAAVINTDDIWGRRLLAALPPQIRPVPFGIRKNFFNKIVADEAAAALDPDAVPGTANGFFAENLALSAAGSTFTLRCPAGSFAVRTRLPGDYNASNVLCALAVVHALGANLADAVRNVADFEGVPGRMDRVRNNPFPFDVFVDYAHTDDALANALGMLKKITRGRLLVVFGCGGNRDRGKRPKMVRAVQKFADFAWATSDNPRKEPLEQIFADMQTGIVNPEKIIFEPDRRRAIGLAIDAAAPGDCVLIAGKGHETYQEFAEITLPFDDRTVAAELLALRRCRLSDARLSDSK